MCCFKILCFLAFIALHQSNLNNNFYRIIFFIFFLVLFCSPVQISFRDYILGHLSLVGSVFPINFNSMYSYKCVYMLTSIYHIDLASELRISILIPTLHLSWVLESINAYISQIEIMICLICSLPHFSMAWGSGCFGVTSVPSYKVELYLKTCP